MSGCGHAIIIKRKLNSISVNKNLKKILLYKSKYFFKRSRIGIPMIAEEFNETIKEIDRRCNSIKKKYQTVNSL